MIQSLISYVSTNHDLVLAATAISALFVSICSLVLTVTNISMQRAHNRKNVIPIAYITVGDYENHTFVRLRNYGIGPMLIEKAIIAQKGKGDETGSTLIECMPDLPDGYYWKDFVEEVTNRAIPANGEITLVEFEGDMSDKKYKEIRKDVRGALANLTVTVEYRNVYGERMPSVTRTLDWFGRKTYPVR
jgi:hypothetical protein